MNDSIFHSRAVPTNGNLENDADVMVHQQLARLYFFEAEVGTAGATVLDFGCGSGFNCRILRKRSAKVVGFDYSPEVVALASKKFPDCEFLVADGCDPALSLGKFERIVCCEVLEHVPDMPQFIKNIGSHLTDNGIAWITTPNISVFSNGHRPSPVNREHIREVDIHEFRELLRSFANVRVFGQRFVRRELRDRWKRDVDEKITLLEAGNRWHERVAPHPLLTAIHSFPPVRWGWTQLRWRLIEELRMRQAVRNRPYDFRDFEFVENQFDDAIWLCAIASQPSRNSATDATR